MDASDLKEKEKHASGGNFSGSFGGQRFVRHGGPGGPGEALRSNVRTWLLRYVALRTVWVYEIHFSAVFLILYFCCLHHLYCI